MPSASTPVCSLHCTRQSHSSSQSCVPRRRGSRAPISRRRRGTVEALSTESLCARYLRSQAAGAFARSRMADRRRTLRGWHLPSTTGPLHTHGLADSQPRRISRRERAARLRPGSNDCSLDRPGPRSRAKIRHTRGATLPVLSRSAVDAAFQASEPTPRNHRNHGSLARRRMLRRDVVPGLSPRRDHGVGLLWCLPLSRATGAG
jgi:hypothetical protein